MKTRIWIAVAACSAALFATNAHAQGRRPTPTPTPTPSSPWMDPTVNTTPAPATTHSSPVMSAASAPTAVSDDVKYRPEGKSIGIGAGYSSATMINIGIENVGAPDVVSARFRMESGLAVEPMVVLGISTGSSKVTGAPADTSTGVDMAVGGNVRKPFWSRNEVEAIFIVGGALLIGSDSAKTAGVKTTSTAFGINANYGVGVEWFPRTHWSLSLDATNPILSLTSSSTKSGGVTQTTTGIFIGAVFDPSVRVMTHLYY